MKEPKDVLKKLRILHLIPMGISHLFKLFFRLPGAILGGVGVTGSLAPATSPAHDVGEAVRELVACEKRAANPIPAGVIISTLV